MLENENENIRHIREAVERQLNWTIESLESEKQLDFASSKRIVDKLTGEKDAYEFVLKIIEIWE